MLIQGLIFNNERERTALLQFSGGPCTVITAVQAYLLKELIFCVNCGANWRNPESKFSLMNNIRILLFNFRARII